MANKGWKKVVQSNPALAPAFHTIAEAVIHPGVSKAFPEFESAELSKFF
jgi:alanine dehydrogenase